MNTNISISLDTRRQLKDGSYPLIMRLGHEARTTSINLNISLKTTEWDDKNKQVRKSYTGVSSVSRLNNQIQKSKSDAMDIIFKLHECGELSALSITGLKEKIVNQNKTLSFFEYTNQLIDELRQAKRIGTAESFKDVVGVLKSFNNSKELHFKEMTYSFLTRFETHHKAKGNQTNGLAAYMRTIRSIFNKAIKAGIAEKEMYPFNDYKIKTVPTEKRAIDQDVLKKIILLEFEPGTKYFNARNYFVASYMMYGMSFTDMAFLKKSNIQDGRIYYRRKKTSKLYDIKITENLQHILDHYIAQQSESECVFQIVKRETPDTQAKDVKWARKRYNKKLKEIAVLCGIDKNLTSYVSRHTFATQAMLMQVPLNAISSMLGHSSLKTTEIYLKSLPTNILDDYNALVTGIF